MKTLVWFREDLRIADNPALHYAANQGDIVAVFIYPQGLGGARYWWLNQSLQSLMNDLNEHGVSLILKTGEPEQVLSDLVEQLSPDSLVWNRVYSPQGMEQGARVKERLSRELDLRSFNGQLLIEPGKVFNKQGTPFKVFTPFWRHCRAELKPPPVLPVPQLNAAQDNIESETLASWGLHPTQPDWSEGMAERWQPGEAGAQQRLKHFLSDPVNDYKEGRDIPGQFKTSFLSPHLVFGEISPKQIWFAIDEAILNGIADETNANKFLSEIGWREFSRYLLVHFPELITQPFNARFDLFPWQDAPDLVNAWQRGQTGYPIVDAGMRELWQTGYMHNRVRMIVASFLCKHCLTHWQVGLNWFWDTLVDADIANNTASWQWAAGCGADAAPYFRIFNPVLQGEKFDKQGDYVKKWVPELSDLTSKYIHKPWEADPMTLQLANVQLGVNYPKPIVDHKQARALALDSYQAIKINSNVNQN